MLSDRSGTWSNSQYVKSFRRRIMCGTNADFDVDCEVDAYAHKKGVDAFFLRMIIQHYFRGIESQE